VAINKANTPLWMKATLILLAVVFVTGFVSLGASSFSSMNSGDGATTTDPVQQVNQQFQPTVDGLTSQLQSDPESYTVLVQLGNQYFDWAIAMSKASETASAALGADQQLWTSAKDAYARAVAVRKDESPVLIDYSITLFYSGDTNKAIETASGVVKSDPTFAPAYFNLGVFNEALGNKDVAIKNLEQYLKLDPKGESGNADYAKEALTRLGK